MDSQGAPVTRHNHNQLAASVDGFGANGSPDGRQSPTALRIVRGTRRLLRHAGFASVTELSLPSGHRADIVCVHPDGTIKIIEVKSSPADFWADRKWHFYRDWCDELFFAVDLAMPADLMPQDAGLIVADGFGALVTRIAPVHRLAAATRRAMLLRFARAAADRLHSLDDPVWSEPQI